MDEKRNSVSVLRVTAGHANSRELLTNSPEQLYGRSMICKPATFRAIRRRRARDSEGRRRVRRQELN